MTKIKRNWGEGYTLSPEGEVKDRWGDLHEGIRVTVIPTETGPLYQAFRAVNGATIERLGKVFKTKKGVLAAIDRITHEEWEAEFERKHDVWGPFIYDPEGKATFEDFKNRCKEKAESFTAKDYDELEDINYHGVNAMILAYKYVDSELYHFVKRADGSTKLLNRDEFLKIAEANFKDFIYGGNRRRFQNGIHSNVYMKSHGFYYNLPDAEKETTEAGGSAGK